MAGGDIGSVPYLVKEGYNGLVFSGPSSRSTLKKPDMRSLDELEQKVCALLAQPDRLARMQQHAEEEMRRLWSPQRAAGNLLQLISDLECGRETTISEGPCSKA